MSVALLLFATLAIGQDNPTGDLEDSGIAPPVDLNIQPPPPETVPAPQGERERRLDLGREIDLGKLGEQLGPEGQRFLHRSGDRGISFGLDMARRGINFGMRYAHGQATPADARAFGIDMGRRGREFGLQIRDDSLDTVEGALPRDGRDADFQETPSDITIDAPPLPLGAIGPRPKAQVFGRDTVDREVKFRREF